jgi:hypothetical protein
MLGGSWTVTGRVDPAWVICMQGCGYEGCTYPGVCTEMYTATNPVAGPYVRLCRLLRWMGSGLYNDGDASYRGPRPLVGWFPRLAKRGVCTFFSRTMLASVRRHHAYLIASGPTVGSFTLRCMALSCVAFDVVPVVCNDVVELGTMNPRHVNNDIIPSIGRNLNSKRKPAVNLTPSAAVQPMPVVTSGSNNMGIRSRLMDRAWNA